MGIILDRLHTPQDIKGLNTEEMHLLAAELRQEILQTVSQTGGHLAPSLGVVELTVALHKFLDLPKDEIVWDVGHQCYAHKILTGRREQFATLRQLGGLSGFPKPCESPYDAYLAGHSSTSISVAVGLAQAAKLNQEEKRVVAVIGDGALSGGMVYEAMNHGGDLRTPFTVILNDNEMSIAENVGSMSKYLTRLRTNRKYQRLKQRMTHRLLKIPKYGQMFYHNLERFRDRIKYFLLQGVFFEEMGFVYLGPVDGHDITALLDVLTKAQEISKPTIIHIITQKGRGYLPAEQNPTAFHGTAPFDLKTGKTAPKTGKTYTQFFSEALLQAAAADSKVVAITAAMPDGTGLNPFAKQYPERFYDVGIAEPHAVTFAGALASRGLRPVACLYSTFLQRAYDQLMQDVCMAKAPVVLAIDRAGIVGEDGETHQGLFDLAMLRQMPNLNILAPRDGQTLAAMLPFALALKQPAALRYPRGTAAELADCPVESLELGKGQVLRPAEPGPKTIGILALGSMVERALQAAAALEKQGVQAAVADLQFVKPLDETLVASWAKDYGKLAVLEDGIVKGGVGSACLEALQQQGVQADVLLCGFPDQFIPHGKPAELYDLFGLSAEKIAARILERWFL